MKKEKASWKKLIRNFRKLGAKEFFRRWKKGIEEVTENMPIIKQVDGQIRFTKITIAGLILGMIISIYKISQLWWVGIILFGALGNSYIGLIALKQKKNMLKPLIEIKGGDEENV